METFLKENIDNYQFVDLGLPSGKFWMRHLLGMNSDTDIHNALYFQWGSKKGYKRNGKLIFSTENCNYKKTEWNLFGDNVKLPNKEDFRELLDNTEQKVETIDGVKGIRFVSKNNGNSIFVPFIGCRLGISIYDQNCMYLWSSTLDVSNHYLAYQLYADVKHGVYISYGNRCNGFGVLGILN